MSYRELEPSEVGIDGVDLKAAGNTEYELGEPLDVRQDFIYVLIVKVVNTGGGSNGDAKLTVDLVSKDKSTVLHQVDILTGIDTKTAGTTREAVKWGVGVTPVRDGASTLDSDGANLLAVAAFINVRLTVTTQNDGTTSVGSVTLLTERV